MQILCWCVDRRYPNRLLKIAFPFCFLSVSHYFIKKTVTIPGIPVTQRALQPTGVTDGAQGSFGTAFWGASLSCPLVVGGRTMLHRWASQSARSWEPSYCSWTSCTGMFGLVEFVLSSKAVYPFWFMLCFIFHLWPCFFLPFLSTTSVPLTVGLILLNKRYFK